MNESARTAQQEDEDTQKKRLLMQYAKFKSLASNFQKYSVELEQGSLDIAEKLLVQLIKELLTMDIWGRKLQAVKAANARDQSNYQKRKIETEKAIIQAHADIEQRKLDLAEAKVERQNNEEYEKLRHQIMHFASRHATLAECQKLESDILGLEAQSAELDLAVERRRKQFGLLMHCIEELQLGEAEDSHAPGLDIRGQVDEPIDRMDLD